MNKALLLKEKKKYEQLWNRYWNDISELDENTQYESITQLRIQKLGCEIRIKELEKQIKTLEE